MTNEEMLQKEAVIKEIIDGLSDKPNDIEKVKHIFNWFVENVKYDHFKLEVAKNTSKMIQIHTENNYYMYRTIIDYFANKLDIETLPEDKKNLLYEYIKLNNKKEELANISNSRPNNPHVLISKLGVCEDFSNSLKEICDLINVKCETIQGYIFSGGIKVGHQWNMVVVGDRAMHIDISSAIHNKEENKNPNEYFGLTTQQLIEKDKDKNRGILKDSMDKVMAMENIASDTRSPR